MDIVGGMHVTWEIELNAELGFIDTVFKGTITNQDSIDATLDALALASGKGPHMFLTDVLNAESQLSATEIYGVPRQWEALGANRANKLALVVPEGGSLWKDARFYETACRNEGWQVEVFSQRQEAIDWLTRRHPPNKPDADNG